MCLNHIRYGERLRMLVKKQKEEIVSEGRLKRVRVERNVSIQISKEAIMLNAT